MKDEPGVLNATGKLLGMAQNQNNSGLGTFPNPPGMAQNQNNLGLGNIQNYHSIPSKINDTVFSNPPNYSGQHQMPENYGSGKDNYPRMPEISYNTGLGVTGNVQGIIHDKNMPGLINNSIHHLNQKTNSEGNLFPYFPEQYPLSYEKKLGQITPSGNVMNEINPTSNIGFTLYQPTINTSKNQPIKFAGQEITNPLGSNNDLGFQPPIPKEPIKFHLSGNLGGNSNLTKDQMLSMGYGVEVLPGHVDPSKPHQEQIRREGNFKVTPKVENLMINLDLCDSNLPKDYIVIEAKNRNSVRIMSSLS